MGLVILEGARGPGCSVLSLPNTADATTGDTVAEKRRSCSLSRVEHCGLESRWHHMAQDRTPYVSRHVLGRQCHRTSEAIGICSGLSDARGTVKWPSKPMCHAELRFGVTQKSPPPRGANEGSPRNLDGETRGFAEFRPWSRTNRG